VVVECWDGYYRARFSARGYSRAQSVEADADFRLPLWPHEAAVSVVKQRHGWAS
jgi:hypothetical protein